MFQKNHLNYQTNLNDSFDNDGGVSKKCHDKLDLLSYTKYIFYQ